MPSKKVKDATRSERKSKRRALEDRIPDIPGDADENNPEELEGKESIQKKRSRDTTEVDDDTQTRSSKRARKNDHQSKAVEIQRSSQEDGQDGVTELRKSKKERKAERKKALQATAATDHDKPETSNEAEERDSIDNEKEAKVTKSIEDVRESGKKRPTKAPLAGGKVEEGADEKSSKAPPRFIVFVGNLPFTATKESIRAHFAKVKPKDIRCLTEKGNPSKSRGIAFIEFEGYDTMKTCLKLMHHSEFDDGQSAPRKINVELTAGGGGKTKQRTAKIAEKNQKLQEERFRRVQAEDKVKAEKRGSGNTGDIHPSRRGQLGLD